MLVARYCEERGGVVMSRRRPAGQAHCDENSHKPCQHLSISSSRAGGDGTVGDVVSALENVERRVAILPLGGSKRSWPVFRCREARVEPVDDARCRFNDAAMPLAFVSVWIGVVAGVLISADLALAMRS
jgi:hypothetical protein